ncbi:MAG: ABC-type multidrug transport system, ATPase and permease component [Patescibacteria group bacterium]|nr:ABC-type multidrug transport system, ATPase and permease component [Patescibacteria group bacterium]
MLLLYNHKIMAKLPNIIEKDRSLWKVLVFAIRESIKGSPGYSVARYIFATINATLIFVQFGGLAIIVNEFTRAGIQNAHLNVIVGAFALIVTGTLVPSIVASLSNFVFSVQFNDMQKHIQKIIFSKMDSIDIATVEHSEFQNMFDVASNRGWGAMTNSVNTVSNSLGNITALVIATVSLIVISPIVLVVLIASAVPTYFLEKKNAERTAELWKASSEQRRTWNSKSEPINKKDKLIELKNFNLVKIFSRKWQEAIGAYYDKEKKLDKKTLGNEILGDVLLILGYSISFFLIILKIYEGGLLLGSLLFTFTVISRFQSAIQALFENFGRLNEQKKYLNTFMDFTEIKPLIVSGDKLLDPHAPITIEFKNVSFSYPGTTKKILKDISLVFSPGENIAIVGLNGAGKTTLIKLLTRVYDPTKGKILVNGISLKEYDLKSWKECLGILLQEYAIYSEETVEENIMLGDTSKHDSKFVIASAQETTIADVIVSLPEKYNQKVGTEFKGGVEFSKGQKQKLALARTLYRNAPIMILDEPTASIDAVSEDTIFKHLKANHTDQTRIVISHKFSNVRDSDQIILIQNGSILEQGSHEELIGLNGTYKELFELQAEGYR